MPHEFCIITDSPPCQLCLVSFVSSLTVCLVRSSQPLHIVDVCVIKLCKQHFSIGEDLCYCAHALGFTPSKAKHPCTFTQICCTAPVSRSPPLPPPPPKSGIQCSCRSKTQIYYCMPLCPPSIPLPPLNEAYSVDAGEGPKVLCCMPLMPPPPPPLSCPPRMRRTMWMQVKDPSLLRFMVDLRDADIDDKQLRDDLMTMLIAGHETTAAVLTWTLFQLMQSPEALAKAVQEIDQVVGDDTPSEALCIRLGCFLRFLLMNWQAAACLHLTGCIVASFLQCAAHVCPVCA